MRFVASLLFAILLGAAGCASTPQGESTAAGLPLISVGALRPSRVLVQIARVKNPTARPLKFADEVRFETYHTLQPGDILLTYTAGVTSNVVVPGKFKHALIYVGPVENEEKDAVEATGDGVRLTSVHAALDTRINRLAVLRPRLSPEDRAAYISEVLSYVGEKYDFSFDFTDPTRKSCTEIVYCALHGRAGIHFPLTTRAGRGTLTADDIVMYHLRQSTPLAGFECVLFASEDPESAGHAQVITGHDSHLSLAQLMRVGSASRK